MARGRRVHRSGRLRQLRRARSTFPEQRGVSLVEALIVLALVSSLVLVIAYGFQFTTETDGRTNRQQRLNAAATSVTEALASPEIPFKVCCPASDCTNAFNHPDPNDPSGPPQNQGMYASTPAYYEDKADSLLPASRSWTYQITGVQYWEAGDFSTTPTVPGEFGSACSPDTDALKFQLTVTLGDDALSTEVVKRRPLAGEPE